MARTKLGAGVLAAINEQIRISDLYAGRAFLYRLVKALAGARPAN